MIKFFYKETGIFVTALAMAIGVTIGVKSIGYNPNPTKERSSSEPIALTHQEKFLQNIMNIATFDVEGLVNFKTEGFKNAYDLNLSASGDLSDLDNVKLNGNLNANVDGLKIGGDFGFYDNTVYLSVDNKTKFKLGVDTVTDFFTKLPEAYGIKFELPEELTNIDLDEIQTKIKDMDEVVTPSGEYYFVLTLVEGLDLYLKTTPEYDFTGIRTDSIFFNGMYIKVDININYVETPKYLLVDPRESADIGLYQDLRPAFTLFDTLYNVFSDGNKASFNIALDVDKSGQNFMNGELGISLDFDEMAFSVDGNVNQNFKSVDRKMNFSMDYLDNAIYAALGDVKVSFQTETITSLISYVIDKTGFDVMGFAMDKLSEILADPATQEMMDKAGDILGDFTIEEGKIALGLDLSVFTDQLSPISIELLFGEDGNSQSFISLDVQGLSFNEFDFGFKLTSAKYLKHNVVKEEYVAIDPAIRLADAVSKLIDRKNFRIEFDAKVEDITGEKADINVDGGLQFDLDQKMGNGQLTIVDRDNYNHNIKADMKNEEQILLSYNDTMDIKFNSNTMLEMLDLVMGIVQNPDDHFKELLADFFDAFEDGILIQILNNQDYGALLALHLVDKLEITENKISMDIDLSSLGFEASMTFELLYEDRLDDEQSYLGTDIKGIIVSNCIVGNTNISFNASLKEFDSNKNVLLDPYLEYMDFSNIKVLLELGLNTSRFNYYKFEISAKAGIQVLGFDIGIDLSIVAKIRNNHGKVQFSFEFDVPNLLLGLNKNTSYGHTYDGRKAAFYFDDGDMYVYRKEKVNTSAILLGKKYNYMMVRRFDYDYFSSHILDIICGDLLCIRSDILTKITDIDLGGGDRQIPYEKLLTTFVYNKTGHFFYFELNMQELTGSNAFDPLYLTINTNTDDTELKSINATLKLAGFINAEVSLKLVDAQEELTPENELTNLNAFVAQYKDLTLNQKYEYATKA